MQDPDLISLFVTPLENAGIIIEQQPLDLEYLETSLTSLHLTPHWQTAQALTERGL
jgi:hypothetical protein